jgi:outer membrane lipoprotein-sorting protein
MTGNIAIVFSDPGLQLKQWTVVDAQGLATTVSLHDIQTGVALQPGLFLTHG